MKVEEDSGVFLYVKTEVDQDLSYFTTFEDEVTGLQHYIPECNLNYFDYLVGLDAFDLPESSSTESFLCATEYDELKFDGDALELYLAQEETKGDSKRVQSSDEKIPPGDFSCQSTCQGIVLGTEVVNEVSKLNYNAWRNSCPENEALAESPSFSFQETEFQHDVFNLSSRAMVFESTEHMDSFLLDKMTVQDLRQIFRNMFGCETSVTNKQWLKHHILFGLQNRGERVNCFNLLEWDKTSNSDDRKTVSSSSIGSSKTAPNSDDISGDQLVSEKLVKKEDFSGCNSLNSMTSSVRALKFGCTDEADTADMPATPEQTYRPSKRCAEGPQDQIPKYNKRRCEASSKIVGEELPLAKSHVQHHQRVSGTAQLVFENRALIESNVPVPLDLPFAKKKSKKNTSLVNDSNNGKDNSALVLTGEIKKEICSVDSADDLPSDYSAVKTGKVIKGRRHIKWTTSEVMTLIDGVSKCGPGKWKDIKIKLFTASSHRTTINLKDKWRSLVKASNDRLKERKVDYRQTEAALHLPESVWQQIRELAVRNTSPRKYKSNSSYTKVESLTVSNCC